MLQPSHEQGALLEVLDIESVKHPVTVGSRHLTKKGGALDFEFTVKPAVLRKRRLPVGGRQTSHGRADVAELIEVDGGQEPVIQADRCHGFGQQMAEYEVFRVFRRNAGRAKPQRRPEIPDGKTRPSVQVIMHGKEHLAHQHIALVMFTRAALGRLDPGGEPGFRAVIDFRPEGIESDYRNRKHFLVKPPLIHDAFDEPDLRVAEHLRHQGHIQQGLGVKDGSLAHAGS